MAWLEPSIPLFKERLWSKSSKHIRHRCAFARHSSLVIIGTKSGGSVTVDWGCPYALRSLTASAASGGLSHTNGTLCFAGNSVAVARDSSCVATSIYTERNCDDGNMTYVRRYRSIGSGDWQYITARNVIRRTTLAGRRNVALRILSIWETRCWEEISGQRLYLAWMRTARCQWTIDVDKSKKQDCASTD